MTKFEKIYEDIIPSNVIVDKESILKCMSFAYSLGVSDTKKKYESLIEDLIDDNDCISENSLSNHNRKKIQINL